jgi:hypothetical protein
MLDDVAAFLVVGPLASSLALVVLLAFWLLGGRGLGRRPATTRVTLVETEAPVRGKT